MFDEGGGVKTGRDEKLTQKRKLMTLFNTCHNLGSDPQHGCANKTLKVLSDMCFAESLDASYETKISPTKSP